MGQQLMRVRMLHPGSEEFEVFDRHTVPIRIDINDDSLPDHPVFRWHRTALDNNPWIRRRFGHCVVIDPVNEEVVGVSFGPHVGAHLRRILDEYAATPRRPPLPNTPEIPKHLKSTLFDPHFMTAYELAFDTWLGVVDLLSNEQQLAPGVRNLAIRVIADLLHSEVTPEYFERCRATGIAVQQCANRTVSTATEAQMARLPRRVLGPHDRAAIALTLILELPLDVRDPEIVAKVRAWWREHEADDSLRVRFSDDPRLRYAFLQ